MHDSRRLYVFVRFCQANLTAVSAERLARWRKDLTQAIERNTTRRRGVVGLVPPPEHDGLDADELRELQADCRHFLDLVIRPEGSLERRMIGRAAPPGWSRVVWLRRGGVSLHTGSTFRVVASMTLGYLLVPPKRGAPPRVQQCPVCRELFVRHSKQKFCSTTCTNRATQRRWRQHHHGRKA